MEVQLKTAAAPSDPTYYWDDESLDTIEYVKYFSETVGYVWDGVDGVERIMEQANYRDFIVSTNPSVTDWEDADMVITVYDGHIE